MTLGLAIGLVIGVLAGAGFAWRVFRRTLAGFRSEYESRLEHLGGEYNAIISEVTTLYERRAEEVRLSQDLATAHKVQDTLMPKDSAEYGGLRLCGRSFTARECGGDWWYHREIDGQLVLWIGDVTGHSVASALIACAARAAASGAHEAGLTDPAAAVGFFNRIMTPLIRERFFITTLMIRIDLRTGLGEYCQASHEPALVIRPAQRRRTFLCEGNNPPIGIHSDWTFQKSTLQLEPGDLLFAYTDGLHEMHMKRREHWSQKATFRFLERWQERGEGAKDLIAELNRQVDEATRSEPLTDDVTFVAVEVPPTEKTLGHVA